MKNTEIVQKTMGNTPRERICKQKSRLSFLSSCVNNEIMPNDVGEHIVCRGEKV